MSSCTQLIKQQLEQILKDTKILCELEPFVKKWSLEETFPDLAEDKVEKSRDAAISEILKTGMETESGERNSGEQILRKLKEVMSAPKSNNNADDQYDPGHLIPFHQSYKSDGALLGKQYDRELENTLMALQHIQALDAVSPRDIEEYRRGLGGKPDGPEFDKTTMREWKNIFLEHWIHLNQSSKCEKEAFIKRIIAQELSHNDELRSSLSIPILSRKTLKSAEPNKCTSPRIPLATTFMTTNGNKNITPSNTITLQSPKRPNSSLPSSSHSTYFPNLHQHHQQLRNDEGKRAQTALERRQTTILTLKGGSPNQIETSHLEQNKKSASSANKRRMMGVHPQYKSIGSAGNGSQQGAGNVHYIQQGRATKKLVNKNNNKGWESGNTFRSSTAIKTNIEIQRFKEKMVKPRPATSIPAAMKPNRYAQRPE